MKLKRWDTQEVIFELECSSWADLLKGALKAKVSLYRADFSEANFIEANFRWADFSEANFIEANFIEANFRGANFSEANFRGANFRWADFRWADFSEANFSEANFIEADFRGADFSEANFREADFRGDSYQYCIGNMREIKSMQLDTYLIVFNKHFLAIGCQQHSIEKWKNFTDDEIENLDNGALEWWNKWKDFIFKAIELCYEK